MTEVTEVIANDRQTMPQPTPFFLTGSFNDWRPDDPRHQFAPVVSPYGRDACGVEHPELVFLGGYSLEVDLPTGMLAFKIVDGDSKQYWSVAEKRDDPAPYSISKYRFETRHGMRPCSIAEHASSDGPNAQFHNVTGKLRLDFHPPSRTLAIHDQFHRSKGVDLRPWRVFSCAETEFETWVALPYGYQPSSEYAYPVWYVFDGRCLLYGENPWRGQLNELGRQFPRLLDTLARHGVVSPSIVVGLGVPGIPPQRRKTYWRHTSWLHKAFVNTLCESVLPAVQREFPASKSPTQQYLMGLSNGGDISLAVIARAAEHFGGALALSPEGADFIAPRFQELSEAQRRRLSVAISYAEQEPSPSFQTSANRAARQLQELGVATLLHYIPGISHTDPGILDHVAGCVRFVMEQTWNNDRLAARDEHRGAKT